MHEIFRVETAVVSPFGTNAYLLACLASKEAAWIDPGDDAPRLARIAEASGVKVMSILLTHAHVDHIAAAGALREATGAPVALHAGDLELYRRAREQGELFGWPVDPLPDPDRLLGEGDEIRIGELRGRVAHSPGHSPGGVLLDFPGANLHICGDTLFREGIGRTDLWEGSWEALERSIRTRIFTLPDERLVLPGHGPHTTVGWEKAHNPFVRVAG